MKFMLIPPGEFEMGSDSTEVAALLEEAKARELDGFVRHVPSQAPKHRVTISRGFYFSIHEVTQGQYEKITGANPSSHKPGGDRAKYILGMDTSTHPVENVSWQDAVDFCQKLSSLAEEKGAGRVYRLPTEAQWEYACRAGTVWRFCSGDDEESLGRVAWWGKNSGAATHPVGRKEPNSWGLNDMHGNVAEWCTDWFGPYQPWPAYDPVGLESGAERVARGRGWGARLSSHYSSADRDALAPGRRNDGLGLRVIYEVGNNPAHPGETIAATPGAPSAPAPAGSQQPKPSAGIAKGKASTPASPQAARQQAVREIKALGGRLLTQGYKPCWSPDGKRIAFSRSRIEDGVGILDIAAGTTTHLVAPGKDPAWSPGNGKHVAYSVKPREGGEEIWLIEAAGGKPRRLAEGGFPTWSSDGSRLFYQSRKEKRLKVLRLAGESVTASDGIPIEYPYPAISPDDRQVAYRLREELVVADVMTGDVVKRWRLPPSSGLIATFTPDGKRLGFGGWGGHDTLDLSIMNLGTGQVTRVLSRQFTHLLWSPDGSKLTVDLRPRSGWEIWLLDAKSTVVP